MHLISNDTFDIHLNGSVIHFNSGESIITEYSYKYTPETFAKLASDYFDVKKFGLMKKIYSAFNI
jgi:L-histidine Nalpha-methyltransferase